MERLKSWWSGPSPYNPPEKSVFELVGEANTKIIALNERIERLEREIGAHVKASRVPKTPRSRVAEHRKQAARLLAQKKNIERQREGHQRRVEVLRRQNDVRQDVNVVHQTAAVLKDTNRSTSELLQQVDLEEVDAELGLLQEHAEQAQELSNAFQFDPAVMGEPTEDELNDELDAYAEEQEVAEIDQWSMPEVPAHQPGTERVTSKAEVIADES